VNTLPYIYTRPENHGQAVVRSPHTMTPKRRKNELGSHQLHIDDNLHTSAVSLPKAAKLSPSIPSALMTTIVKLSSVGRIFPNLSVAIMNGSTFRRKAR
jgi:hypothetical protein